MSIEQGAPSWGGLPRGALGSHCLPPPPPPNHPPPTVTSGQTSGNHQPSNNVAVAAAASAVAAVAASAFNPFHHNTERSPRLSASANG